MAISKRNAARIRKGIYLAQAHMNFQKLEYLGALDSLSVQQYIADDEVYLRDTLVHKGYLRTYDNGIARIAKLAVEKLSTPSKPRDKIANGFH